MYYLMSEKNESGQEIVNSQRYITSENKHTILHKFESWEEVWQYMIAPAEWKERNLGDVE